MELKCLWTEAGIHSASLQRKTAAIINSRVSKSIYTNLNNRYYRTKGDNNPFYIVLILLITSSPWDGVWGWSMVAEYSVLWIPGSVWRGEEIREERKQQGGTGGWRLEFSDKEWSWHPWDFGFCFQHHGKKRSGLKYPDVTSLSPKKTFYLFLL